MFSFSMMVSFVLIIAAATFVVFHYKRQARIRRAFIVDVYRVAKSEGLEVDDAFSRKPDLDEFARDLFRSGVHVLACGGGVIPEPRSAIDRLKYKYGKEGLLWGSYLIYVDGKDVLKKPLLEGTGSVVCGILYYLGNQELLDKLIAIYRKEMEAGKPSVTAEDTPGMPGVSEAVPARGVAIGHVPRAGGAPQGRPLADQKHYHLGSSETLVAGICDRLGRPLPAGVRPLSPEDKAWLFN